MSDEAEKRASRSEKIRIAVISALAGGATAGLGALATVAGGWFEYSNQNRALDLELARLSLAILAGEYDADDDEATPLPARRFALSALSASTGIDIPEDDFVAWVERGATPVSELESFVVPDFIAPGLR